MLFGRPLATNEELDERLPKVKALSTFSSDNLSSVAYATELIMFTLVAAGTNAFWLVMPISLLIVTIFVIIVISYRQTIRAYPSGGGSYIVARENLGRGRRLSPPPRCSRTTCSPCRSASRPESSPSRRPSRR
jgi:hypothetical protein